METNKVEIRPLIKFEEYKTKMAIKKNDKNSSKTHNKGIKTGVIKCILHEKR